MKNVMEITAIADRETVAGILVKNGYRVWLEKVKKGSKTVIVVCCDREASQDPRQQPDAGEGPCMKGCGTHRRQANGLDSDRNGKMRAAKAPKAHGALRAGRERRRVHGQAD